MSSLSRSGVMSFSDDGEIYHLPDFPVTAPRDDRLITSRIKFLDKASKRVFDGLGGDDLSRQLIADINKMLTEKDLYLVFEHGPPGGSHLNPYDPEWYGDHNMHIQISTYSVEKYGISFTPAEQMYHELVHAHDYLDFGRKKFMLIRNNGLTPSYEKYTNPDFPNWLEENAVNRTNEWRKHLGGVGGQRPKY